MLQALTPHLEPNFFVLVCPTARFWKSARKTSLFCPLTLTYVRQPLPRDTKRSISITSESHLIDKLLLLKCGICDHLCSKMHSPHHASAAPFTTRITKSASRSAAS